MASELRVGEPSLFIDAFQYASIGMTLVSLEGVWLRVNASFCQFLGYREEELLQTTFHAITHPDDLATDLQYMKQLIEGDMKSYVMEKRYIHRTGKPIWGLLHVSIVEDDQGTPLYFFSQIQDITDQKLVKCRLESFFKNNADAILMSDLDGNIVEVNSTFETMFGWSSAEFIGNRLPNVPDSMLSAMQQLHQHVKVGNTVVGFETTRQKKNGDILDVSATLSPVYNEEGDIIGISEICRDITTRKTVQKEARIARQNLESFIENYVDGIVLFSSEGKIVRVNQAFEKIFGCSANELLHRYILDCFYIPPDLKETEILHIIDTVKKGQPIMIEETKRANIQGEPIDVMLTAFPMNNVHGEFNGWAVVLRDIREWKKSREILQQSEKLSLAGQLAAGIAHEIRNPITSIKGFLQLMRTGFGHKEEYLDIMSAEIDRIEIILSELLILAKPQSSKYEEADLQEILEQVITLLGTQGNLHNIQIDFKVNEYIPTIPCDKNQLKQVFINFIKNSMEAMPNGGIITIDVSCVTKTELRIRFIDQGCGIAEEIIEKLGQPFFTTKEKGTGLGFMISKKIVEDHNGRLTVHSKVNEGTMIELQFPLVDKRGTH